MDFDRVTTLGYLLSLLPSPLLFFQKIFRMCQMVWIQHSVSPDLGPNCLQWIANNIELSKISKIHLWYNCIQNFQSRRYIAWYMFGNLVFLSFEKEVKIRGFLYSKFSFGEVYRRIYGRNLDLRWRVSKAVKRDIQTYIQWHTSPNENFEYGYPH